ncbi:hypothetical protein [Sphingobacterium sp. UBA2074]|uniref:hypothetical protein n=1 Tax=Sphingobacterium sp. UBA2074 TaxID=1947487 RepID=UPI00257FE881|nr:hypothetical protein [Sphingobacterium sp. UBA2074]
MITANQLRIGNYVASDHFKDRDVIVKVRLIGQEQAIVEHPSGLSEPMLYQGEMRGVKLTEEILLKCGFKPYGNGKWHHDSISLHEADFIFNSKSDRVKYVHQLQNLFYELTVEELDMKLC